MIAAAGIARPGQTLIADKGYRSAAFEADLNDAGITVLRPATRSEPPRPGARFLRPLRQIIESINQTLKGQLSLERHKGRTRSSASPCASSHGSSPSPPPSGTTRPTDTADQHAHSPPTTTNPLELII